MLARHIVTVGRETIARFEGQGDRSIDPLAAMQFLALEIAGRSMFSVEMGRYGAALRRMIAGFSVKLGRPYLFDMLLPPSIPNWHDLQRRIFRGRWVELMDAILLERQKMPPAAAPRDLFDLLRAARDPETGRGFSHAELRDQVSTMIVAGHETTALTLFWSLYLLASVPAAQERLAKEVAAIEITPGTAGQILPRLAYARAVVSEALRLYPPAFVMVREAIRDDSYAGTAIPAHSQVLIAPWVLHRHRRLWPNPDAFDPERFLSGVAPPRFAYLPFGAGPRVCIGAQFAMAEAVLIVAMLVQRFRITRAGREPVLPVAVVTTYPDHPALFQLEPRSQ
jgi:unspecific monooxygenase